MSFYRVYNRLPVLLFCPVYVYVLSVLTTSTGSWGHLDRVRLRLISSILRGQALAIAPRLPD